MNNIICIAGPTASGKTALAATLAKELNGEVVSCDSMQVYKHMDIGTAKPTLEEMQGIPHHMIDVAEPWEDFSVSRYCDMAAPIVDDIISRGKTAVIAGGTGLYMDALIRGNAFAPFPATGVRERLEAQADAEGMEAMLSRLRAVDPDAARRLHLSDRKRILRALEVYLETGETITQHDHRTRQQPPRYRAAYIGLSFQDRAQLRRRIDLRVDQMMEQDLLNEAKHVWEHRDTYKTAAQAIGYKEFFPYFTGESALAPCVEKLKQASRNYAKRQLTWFRHMEGICWLDASAPDVREQAACLTNEFLAKG